MLLVYWYHLFVWSVVKFYFNFMDFVKRFVCPPICSNNFYTFFTISFVNIFPFSNFSLHLQSLWFSPLFLFLESHFSFPCFYLFLLIIITYQMVGNQPVFIFFNAFSKDFNFIPFSDFSILFSSSKYLLIDSFQTLFFYYLFPASNLFLIYSYQCALLLYLLCQVLSTNSLLWSVFFALSYQWRYHLPSFVSNSFFSRPCYHILQSKNLQLHLFSISSSFSAVSSFFYSPIKICTLLIYPTGIFISGWKVFFSELMLLDNDIATASSFIFHPGGHLVCLQTSILG